ncbi:MAG: CoA-binding protein [Clostridia bacterium]|nr:CoA-binding protein [Clostridia bacterium]
MDLLMDEMLSLKKWAVVGATSNPDKFGNKIYMKLKRQGYDVTPINPVYDEVDGDVCFNSLKDMPEIPECVSVVVSPKRAIVTVEEAIELGIKRLWFQPGTFDEEILDLAENNGIEIVYYNCVLVEMDHRK